MYELRFLFLFLWSIFSPDICKAVRSVSGLGRKHSRYECVNNSTLSFAKVFGGLVWEFSGHKHNLKKKKNLFRNLFPDSEAYLQVI